jgi:exopolysaccharide biosynthesis polyprenyl glycosylphosphotransferase
MELESMGVVVSMSITQLREFEEYKTTIGMIGDVPVVRFASVFHDYNKLLIKRLIDIVGALIGIAITLVVTIFLAPILLIESPGPLFFKQRRVGRNGRFFYMYKFRSMYRDAEERKKELMDQNEMNGLMFKMTDDPRITKVGKFIRKTSIDELPQFFNVLIGDMSLVGTRPPTVDEFKQYESYHKRRLSMKPGITGMWQVSGRSNIEDFEEVVKLDLKYIDNWSIGLDIKILFKTVGAVFRRGGAR